MSRICRWNHWHYGVNANMNRRVYPKLSRKRKPIGTICLTTIGTRAPQNPDVTLIEKVTTTAKSLLIINGL